MGRMSETNHVHNRSQSSLSGPLLIDTQENAERSLTKLEAGKSIAQPSGPILHSKSSAKQISVVCNLQSSPTTYTESW